MVTIYVDVLIILNTYINYGLLRITSLFFAEKANNGRVFLASLFGGIYSLIILWESISPFLLFITKILCALIMTLISFRYESIFSLLKKGVTLLGVSLVFAGAMFSLWLFIYPKTMVFRNSVVYFDFDEITLVIMTAIAYGIVKLIYFIAEKRAPKDFLFRLEISLLGEKVTVNALCDTGNDLKDWFSSMPVIVVGKGVMKAEKTVNSQTFTKKRLIPCSTAYGEGIMPIVKAEKVKITGRSTCIQSEDVFIGFANTKLKNGEFEAIIPYKLLER